MHETATRSVSQRRYASPLDGGVAVRLHQKYFAGGEPFFLRNDLSVFDSVNGSDFRHDALLRLYSGVINGNTSLGYEIAIRTHRGDATRCRQSHCAPWERGQATDIRPRGRRPREAPVHSPFVGL